MNEISHLIYLSTFEFNFNSNLNKKNSAFLVTKKLPEWNSQPKSNNYKITNLINILSIKNNKKIGTANELKKSRLLICTLLSLLTRQIKLKMRSITPPR